MIEWTVGPFSINVQCNLASCMFGIAFFTNAISVAVGPVSVMIAF